MNLEEANQLKAEMQTWIPEFFSISGPWENRKKNKETGELEPIGTYALGIFESDNDQCIISVGSRSEWFYVKKLAFIIVAQNDNEKEEGDDMSHYDSNSFDDGEGHKILIAVDGSHHDEHEFVG